MRRKLFGILGLSVLLANSWCAAPARSQQAPARETGATDQDQREAERQRILQSERWRRTSDQLDKWFAVQQIYRADEVAAITAEMQQRIAHMSPDELEQFLDEMEARLSVLKSPGAADARTWLNQFLAVARNPEQQLGRSRPDVLNMSAAEVREEIQWIEQQRASRQQAQAAFDRTRSVQAQIAADARAQRQAARQPVDRSSWPANTPPVRSRYSPRRDVLPISPNPVYMIGPWGAPYFRFQSPPVMVR